MSGTTERSSNPLRRGKWVAILIWRRFWPDLQRESPQFGRDPHEVQAFLAICGARRAGWQVFGGAAAPPLAAYFFLPPSDIKLPHHINY